MGIEYFADLSLNDYFTGNGSNSKTSGKSGYSNLSGYTKFPYLGGTSYGDGGYGTNGTFSANNNPTGVGQNGYIRIYFIY